MTKKPEPPEPIRWTIYKLAAKRLWLGTVEAADGREAIEKAAADNVKRVVKHAPEEMSPYLITAFMEMKTVWHPIGV